MKYYIGIDGGGSKTIFAISGEDGKILGTVTAGSAFYKQIGEDGVIDLLNNGVRESAPLQKARTQRLRRYALGCRHGENRRQMIKSLNKRF